MDRDYDKLYNKNISIHQVGGAPNKSKSPKKKNTSYNPADIDGETSTGIDKFRKANRLLQNDLNKIKRELNNVKKENIKLKKQIEASKIDNI
jgi:hypothetical protein